MAPRVLFVVNDGRFFLSHREMLADRLRAAGFEVEVACPADDSAEAIRGHGYRHHPVALTRSGRNPLRELAALARMYRMLRAVRPDVVHLVTIKPVLYGGVSARLLRIPALFAISGLGYVFLARGLRAALQRALVWIAYGLALGHPRSRAIFQNAQDQERFVAAGVVPAERTAVIRGSGVDLSLFRPRPEPAGTPVVVLPSRMLWDKGVGEFVEAAAMLRRDGVPGRLVLVGAAGGTNPAAIPVAQLEAWQAEGRVEWWGHRTDMPEVLAQASAVCLPSYREGIPRALIEAAACARAIVTTDVPGCREVVRHGENGLLVPAQDAGRLAQALRALLEDARLRAEMGAAGRRLVEAELAPEIVIGQTLGLYDDLLGRPLRPSSADSSGSRRSRSASRPG
jgi:glycosyltransferase involved in cell wall biosynthesis